MFSRLKSALSAKPETGERAGLRGAIVDRLRGMRGGEAAAPPEVVVSRPSTPIPPKPISHEPKAAVAQPAPVVVAPAAVGQERLAPVIAAAPVVTTAPAITQGEASESLGTAPHSQQSAGAVSSPSEGSGEASSTPSEHSPAPSTAHGTKSAGANLAHREKPVPSAKSEEAKVEEPPKKQSLAALAAAAGKKSDEPKIVHADMGSTDIEHYIARAKANGRDLSTIKGGEGLNVAEDGGKFWGPVDNESSRAKAAEKLLTIDQWECISCGTCVEQTDKVFYLPGDAKATPIAQDGPMDLIQDAIEACPVTCIHWVTPDEAAEKGLATGNEPDSPRPD